MIKKSILLLTVLIFSISINISAQNKDNRRFNPERYQADMERYIIKKADLSASESAAFLPVYREMKKKQRAVFENNNRKFNRNSDAECKKDIQQRDANELQMKKLQQQYHNKFLKILPASKVYKLLREEENFHRHAFNKALENRNKRNDQRKRNENKNRN